MANLPHEQAWGKFKEIKGIKKLIESALLLYALLLDGDTPLWAKALIISALTYLISPIDSVPDFIPLSGLADDLSVLVATLTTLQTQIKPCHKMVANSLYKQL